MKKIWQWAYAHKRVLVPLTGFGIMFVMIILFNYIYVGSNQKYVIKALDRLTVTKQIRDGIVFGAGITKDGRPYKELQGRLDSAADALQAGMVKKLILSGDNRFPYYNEPDAMKNYLVNVRHIPTAQLQTDYAGRSTYETCERAKKIFGLDQAILFSASSHLPRAIFTCRKFGVESYGVAAGANANNAFRREFLARSKAMFNIYIYGEKTILGPKINVTCCQL